jgi:two-component system nitrate/nitrite response regulator NarL
MVESGRISIGDDMMAEPPQGGRLLIIDEHVLVAIGLQRALAERGWDVQANSGPTIHHAVECARRCVAEYVLLGIHVGGVIDVHAIRSLVALGAHVVVLTAERRRIAGAEFVEAGATCWINKETSLDELHLVLCRIASGGSVMGRTDREDLLAELRSERERAEHARSKIERLTKRESLVLGALIDGLGAVEIADAHYVALTTVRSQIRSILNKLDVRSQLAAVAFAAPHRALLPYSGHGHRDRRRTLQRDPSSMHRSLRWHPGSIGRPGEQALRQGA